MAAGPVSTRPVGRLVHWLIGNPYMQKLLVAIAAMVVCAGPALAQAGQPARDCDQDPETTGSLAADPRSVYLPGQHPVRVDPDPPEVSWQAEARETVEQRRQDLLNCGVD